MPPFLLKQFPRINARGHLSSPVGRPFAIILQAPASFHSFFKPSWPSQIDSRKSGKAHGQTGSDGRQEQKLIVTPGVPERVTRHVFSCFTPPQFNVQVFCSPIPLYYHTFDYLSTLFSISYKKTPFYRCFLKSKLGDHGGIRTRDCQDENLES